MSFVKGFQIAGKDKIHEAIRLKGISTAPGDLSRKHRGQMGSLVKTDTGGLDLAQRIGKSLPSSVVGTGHDVTAKKIFG